MSFRTPALALAALLLISVGCGDGGTEAAGDTPNFSEMDEFQTLAYVAGFESAKGLKADSATFAYFKYDTFAEGFRDGLAGDSSRIAYLFGFELGNRIAGDTLSNLDADLFLAGFRSGLERDSSGISDEEMQRITRVVQDSLGLRQLRSAARTDTSAAGQLREINANATASARYLQDIEGQQGVTKTASGVLYKDLEAGSGESPQNETDVVRLRYRGTLADGTVFDESQDGNAMLGLNQVVEGFREGLMGMKVGGKRMLYIPPALGYGLQGTRDGSVPSNSALTFEVELLDVMTLQEAAQPIPAQ